MRTSQLNNEFWLWGGFYGFLIPAALFTLFQIMICFRVAFLDFLFSTWLIFAIAFMEMPPVSAARALNLPIENGGAAFIMCDLNALGYLFVLLFWTVVGVFLGFLGDITSG